MPGQGGPWVDWPLGWRQLGTPGDAAVPPGCAVINVTHDAAHAQMDVKLQLPHLWGSSECGGSAAGRVCVCVRVPPRGGRAKPGRQVGGSQGGSEGCPPA